MTPNVVTLQQFLSDEPVLAVAWDRDCAHVTWVGDDDGCSCIKRTPYEKHGPYVYVDPAWRDGAYVTDGHGCGVGWVFDSSDPLGGRWEISGKSRPIL